MRNQSIGFQDFRDLLFGLDFGQSGDAQAHGHERKADGARLADANFTAKFFYIKDVDVNHIAIADDVVMGGRTRGRGERTDAIVYLLWRFENGLRAGGRRRYHHPKKRARNETPLQSTQSCWLHASG